MRNTRSEGGLPDRGVRGAWRLVVLIPLAAASCAGPGPTQGALQPQSASGPCTIKGFFLARTERSYTDMQVDSSGQACRFTLINPDLQMVENVVWVTEPPLHGRAEASLIDGNQAVGLAYTPTPGYAGVDRFTTTIEPGDTAVTFHITVRRPPG